ncbi:MAG: hypothetical protein K2X00_17755 [Nitrospiraceae bacterium]|nr:hypothetical protein [Nitrospiraceae bacterium]
MHSKRNAWYVPFALCLVLLSQTEGSAATIINFDGLSDSENVTSQFAGLTFSNTTALTSGVSLNEFEFPPRSDFTVVTDDGGVISILFSSPVLSVSGYFTYLTRLNLTAFDSGNNQVGQVVSLFGSNLVLSGDPGSSANELLAVSFAEGIARVTISGDPLGGSFVFDDLTVEPLATTVPEPSSALLFISGVLAVGVLRTLFKII